ncbi:MAG: NFACT family protein [Clostridia bacterium]|nr:NFACT family protein [Clostridia bacterium]
MPLDGIFCKNLCRELETAVSCRVDKIFQPSRDELVILLRSAGRHMRLLISARPGMARIHFTERSPENPATPPMFCMLMRKHLSGAKLLEVRQQNYDRVISLIFSATDEMGDRRNLSLTAELIGNAANIILINEDGRIIDSVRRSDIETTQRLIQPGAIYEPPPSQEKLSPTDSTLADRLSAEDDSLSAALLKCVAGLSPLAARETAFSVSSDDTPYPELSAEQKSALHEYLFKIDSGEGAAPYTLTEDGKPKAFSFLPLRGNTVLYDSYSLQLDAFYEQKAAADRLKSSSDSLLKTVRTLIERTSRKLNLRREELKKCENREQLRIFGELIKANISLIERGATVARVPNYYDPELREISIPLNEALSPAENSARYFKEYRKLCNAESTLKKLIEDCIREAEYLASVSDALSRAETVSEVSEIRDELIAAGYVRPQKGRAPKRKALPFKEYTSPDGYKILVGRNNIQNDLLTQKTAAKTDIWLHTKDIHGSHTVIVCEGTTPPDSTILYAAKVAAFNSQAADSANVPVDYTLIKHVKKPSGSRAGMVIYTNQSTLFVNPEE